jgi:geranyl-CoA carboxylase alpha subunit
VTSESNPAPHTTTVTRIAKGVYRVEMDGHAEIVYVAGGPANCWAFWNGQAFRGVTAGGTQGGRSRGDVPQSLTAPMPATVRKIVVGPGTVVKKGETLILLEAMKMELPLRAPADGVVSRLLCEEGQLVQPDAVLLELR